MFNRLIFLLLLCTAAGHAVAQSQQQEADLKAVFIYNFTKYIEWDTSNDENEFVIGIIGTSYVTAPLTEITRSNTVRDKKIVIRSFSNPEDISHCDILFIPEKLPFSLHSILEHVDKGVLTISEEPGYAKLGTAFNFILVNDKLKFEANLKAIYTSGLKAGSQLLKLAIIVD